ncbi:hypothetical protein HPB52_011506 [Rhipicephalus sanguineus]|uniref:Uncharacterized protein n=1 Tax=Rhipicephalus sanguineus TaxID=34632 RepID=A0A9D4Q9W1_RHISA|nr:hypothetical protein HPB52_011506 [Rhipicephalus sanguineus]
MGIWMTAYVNLQILIHGKGILVPQNRTVPDDFYNAKYGNHSNVTVGYLIMKDLAFLDKVHKGFTQDEKYAHKYMYSQPGALTGTINYYRAFNNDSDQLSKIPYRKINVTTLILWGERDEFIMTRVAYYNQYWLSNSVAIYYEGAGHFPQRECPAHVTDRIREFAKHGNVSIAEEKRWWPQRWWQSRDHCRESRKPRGTWIPRIPPFIPDKEKLPKEMAE